MMPWLFDVNYLDIEVSARYRLIMSLHIKSLDIKESAG